MPLPPLHTERVAAEASARGATPASAFGNDAARPEPDEAVGQLQRGRPHTGTHWHCWRWVAGRHTWSHRFSPCHGWVVWVDSRVCPGSCWPRRTLSIYVPYEGCIKHACNLTQRNKVRSAARPGAPPPRAPGPGLSGSACCYLGPYTQSPRQKSTGARRCRPLRRTPPG